MSGERIINKNIISVEEYLLYLKEIFIYKWAGSIIFHQGRCLDLGCGQGYGTDILASSIKEVTGIDIDRRTIKKASKDYNRSNCHFKLYDGRTIPFPDETFDAVVSFHVIEHIKDDKKFIAEVFRTLKKGGKSIISTPNRLLRLPRGVKPWNIYHIREYTPQELKVLLKENFKDVEILGVDACEDVKRAELERIKYNLKVASFDFFNLRRLLSPIIISTTLEILRFFKNAVNPKKIDNKIAEYRDKDPSLFYKISKDANNSLDILALCKK